MGGNYEKGMYNQLMEVMARLDRVERESKKEATRLNGEISNLKKENRLLQEENRLLKDDNARLKIILYNDSSNTSQPPSTDQKGGKPVNSYNGRTKTGRKAGGQKGNGGTTLTKAEVEEKIHSGRCCHEIKTMGNPGTSPYVTKYVIDLDVETVVTEVRIYADEDGKIHIPPQYRSDVSYGADVKALAVALYGEGVMSNDRVAAFLNAAGGGALGLSEGSVYSLCRKLAEASKHQEPGGFPVEQKNSGNGRDHGNGKRETELHSEFQHGGYGSIPCNEQQIDPRPRFLRKFSGILLHDNETALYHFGTGHAGGNIHIIRYLRKNTGECIKGNHSKKPIEERICIQKVHRIPERGSGTDRERGRSGTEDEPKHTGGGKLW